MKCSVIICVLLCLTSCSSVQLKEKNSKSVELHQQKLAFELCEMYGFDQGVRKKELKGKSFKIGNVMLVVDSINFNKLMNFIKTNGYPNKKLLGKYYNNNECVQAAAGVVLLHNSHRIVHEKKIF